MLNGIWMLMILCPAVYSFWNGTGDKTAAAFMDAGVTSIDLVIRLAGGFMLWCGLLEILRRSGVTDALSGWMEPALRRLFPDVKNHDTFGAIAMNLTANMLGLGNAATPMGLKAVRLMACENGQRLYANRSICMFLVLNSCCIQTLPTSVLALRAAAGSGDPGAIMLPTLLTSCVSAMVGVCLCLTLGRGNRYE